MDPRSPVRPGQPLALAAEQVNWINRQMRGDRGFGAGDSSPVQPAALVVPCSVSTTVTDVSVGHVVKITNSGVWRLPTTQFPDNVARVGSLAAQVIQPVSLDNYADAKCQLGVIVGGTTMPTPSASRIVMVCISGLCVARVRERGGEYLQGPVLRGDDSAEDFIGAAEQCSCGTARILSFIGNVPSFPGLKFAVVLL